MGWLNGDICGKVGTAGGKLYLQKGESIREPKNTPPPSRSRSPVADYGDLCASGAREERKLFSLKVARERQLWRVLLGFLLASNQTDHPFLSPCSRLFRSLCGIKGCMTLRESGFWSLPNSGKKIAGHTCDLNSGNTHHFRKRTGLLRVKSQTGNIADPRGQPAKVPVGEWTARIQPKINEIDLWIRHGGSEKQQVQLGDPRPLEIEISLPPCYWHWTECKVRSRSAETFLSQASTSSMNRLPTAVLEFPLGGSPSARKASIANQRGLRKKRKGAGNVWRLLSGTSFQELIDIGRGQVFCSTENKRRAGFLSRRRWRSDLLIRGMTKNEHGRRLSNCNERTLPNDNLIILLVGTGWVVNKSGEKGNIFWWVLNRPKRLSLWERKCLGTFSLFLLQRPDNQSRREGSCDSGDKWQQYAAMELFFWIVR